MYQALYRKWRPRQFDDVVGQGHITDTLKRQVELGRLSHAYLFTGTRGTGKTSCAKILSKAINCEHPLQGNPCNQCASCVGIDSGAILDVLELDAASNNGVDQVRALRDEAIYTPAAVKKRVYIIDEVHMLSTPAFNALLKILEEPPEHLMFILATTELHKVPATIKSRCQQFSFKRILPQEIQARLQYVAAQEGLGLSDDAARLLACLAEGGLRDALSLLDQCIGASEEVTEQTVLQVLGLAGNLEISRMLEYMIEGDVSQTLAQLAKLYREGKDMSALLGELSALLRDVLLYRTAPQGGEALLSGGYEEGTLRLFAKRLHSAELYQMLSVLQQASAELVRSSNRRTDVELCLIKLCERTLLATPEALLARITRLEQQLAEGEFTSNQPKQSQKNGTEIETQKPMREDPPWDVPVPPAPQPKAPTVPPVQKEVPPVKNPMKNQSGEAVQPTVPAAMGPGKSQADFKQFVAGLRGKLMPSAYTFLAKPSFVTGVFEEQALMLYVDSDMTKNILIKANAQDILAQEAERFTGRKLQVHIHVGKPEELSSPKEEDKLTDLLKLGQQFDNITIR